MIALAVACAGCDQVFGLKPTGTIDPIDAQQFDAPIDAPFQCPMIGSGAPAFSATEHHVVGQSCSQYDETADHSIAVASCIDAMTGMYIAEQHVGDAQMTAASGVAFGGPANSQPQADEPHVTPDGTALYVRYSYYPPTMGLHVGLERFTRSGEGWVYDASGDIALVGNERMSTIEALPGGYGYFIADNANELLHEYAVDATGATSEIAPATPFSQFDIHNVIALMLTTDGQRLILVGTVQSEDATIYADRTAGGAFGAPVPLPGAPAGISDPYMRDDCSRLYFSGTGSVFFEYQQ